jgi:hypothetical protein
LKELHFQRQSGSMTMIKINHLMNNHKDLDIDLPGIDYIFTSYRFYTLVRYLGGKKSDDSKIYTRGYEK